MLVIENFESFEKQQQKESEYVILDGVSVKVKNKYGRNGRRIFSKTAHSEPLSLLTAKTMIEFSKNSFKK
jgi:hypothetical protein